MQSALISTSDVLSALSTALDITEGQPRGHSVRSCVIGMRLGEEMGLEPEERSALYYALLLKDAGCSSNAGRTAELFGTDDHPVKRDLKITNWARRPSAAAYALRNAGMGQGFWGRARHVMRLARSGNRSARELIRLRCDRGAEIAELLGFSSATSDAIKNLDEHWDGQGHPEGRRGEEIPRLARIACLAQTAEVFLTGEGASLALQVARKRRSRWFDPDICDLLLGWEADKQWWDAVAEDAVGMLRLAEPPERLRSLDDSGLDHVAQAFGDIIDAKSPFTYKHSSRVADIAVGISRQLGLDGPDERQVFRASLLHDIGKLGVSNRILDKPGKLSPSEMRAIRKHPVFTWEILSQVPAFQGFAAAAALHHERLDGSGYPWGLDAESLDLGARIVQVSDVFEALTAERAYRWALSDRSALDHLVRGAGRTVDPMVVDALDSLLKNDARRPALTIR